jgi:hypothetical protein
MARIMAVSLIVRLSIIVSQRTRFRELKSRDIDNEGYQTKEPYIHFESQHLLSMLHRILK